MIEHHRFPKDRTRLEKLVRRFILPPSKKQFYAWPSTGLGSYELRDARFKRTFPFRYWLTESVPDYYETVKKFVWDEPRGYIRTRFGRQYNRVKIPTLERGYWDVDQRLLHSSFALLVELIEYDLACRNLDKRKRTVEARKQAGLEYLDWAINDSDCKMGQSPTQAEVSAIMKDLYLWWLESRPMRPEPWSDERIWKTWRDDSTNKRMVGKPHHIASAVEDLHREEDNEMLHRLVSIRDYLWS